jgi:uncharacterized membrane protein YsdA (DUF1294 family)
VGFGNALTAYLVAINIVAFGMFRLDKRRSETGGWRVLERQLLAYAFCGGSLGALLAGQIFRHKTKKQPFRRNLALITLGHITLGAIMFVPAIRTFVFEYVGTIFIALR